MNAKKRNLIALVINGFIAITTFIIMINGIAHGASSGQLGDNMIGLGYFKPYTIDSNIVNGIVAFAMAIFNINNLIEKKDELPRFMVVAQLVSTVGVTVTIMTVVFFLAPVQILAHQSFLMMFTGDMFFFHLINPILSIINFIIIDKSYTLNKKEILIGIVTVIIYSLVYGYEVMIVKEWPDFYGFTFGGNIYLSIISIIVMYLASFAISYSLAKLNSKK